MPLNFCNKNSFFHGYSPMKFTSFPYKYRLFFNFFYRWFCLQAKMLQGKKDWIAEIKCVKFSVFFTKYNSIYRLICNTDNKTQSLKDLLHIVHIILEFCFIKKDSYTDFESAWQCHYGVLIAYFTCVSCNYILRYIVTSYIMRIKHHHKKDLHGIHLMLVFKSALNKFPWCTIFIPEHDALLGSIYKPH